MARRRPSDATSDGPQIAITEPSPQPDQSPWISRPAVRIQRLRPSSAHSPQPALRSLRPPSPNPEPNPFVDSPDGSDTRGTLRRSWSPFRRRLERTSHDENMSASGDGRLSAASTHDGPEQPPEYTDDVVDWLDVLDPEVATVSTLSNVQNSLFVPDLRGFVNRAPLINLSSRSAALTSTSPHGSCDECKNHGNMGKGKRLPEHADSAGTSSSHARVPGTIDEVPDAEVAAIETLAEEQRGRRRRTMSTPASLDSTADAQSTTGLTETARGRYAILPAGLDWEDWSLQERAELDDYVRHLMHSRKERFRRRARGLWQFFKRPLGFLITVWAFLLTFWGAAWVFFLIGWVSVGGRQGYFIEICEQILTALFCVVGIGMAPFRAVDTYHMIFIVRYHRLTLRLRKQNGLPKLQDKNDLPVPNRDALDDLEAQFKQNDLGAMVLTRPQQEKLEHHQRKYHKSHTFYRAHESPTHRAFPISLLITITVLLDLHSMFQMALGGTTWGIYYKRRPAALTAVILSCSLTCNITAGILIALGGRWTRKVEEVEKRVRQALTTEAMGRLEKRARKHKPPRFRADGTPAVPNDEPKDSMDDARDPDDCSSRWAARRVEAAGGQPSSDRNTPKNRDRRPKRQSPYVASGLPGQMGQIVMGGLPEPPPAQHIVRSDASTAV
ncbi:hypothetical protein PENSPDRAFT_619233 [Peniophora sp. CONT]|nr:hypothetical protein PENSPDRAFT_619233 [Peniophora sp. CONT]